MCVFKIPFFTFKDQVIFEKSEVAKDDGTPYTVFTPFSRKWKSNLLIHPIKSFPSKNSTVPVALDGETVAVNETD